MQTEIKDMIGKIENHAATIKNNDPVVYNNNQFPLDSIHWQGDLGILRINGVPEGAKLVKNPSPQLAPGTTKGSRHIIKGLAGVRIYALPNPNALQGNVVECDAPMEVTHPEHGNVTVPSGIYQIRYQRQYAEELRRIMD